MSSSIIITATAVSSAQRAMTTCACARNGRSGAGARSLGATGIWMPRLCRAVRHRVRRRSLG